MRNSVKKRAGYVRGVVRSKKVDLELRMVFHRLEIALSKTKLPTRYGPTKERYASMFEFMYMGREGDAYLFKHAETRRYLSVSVYPVSRGKHLWFSRAAYFGPGIENLPLAVDTVDSLHTVLIPGLDDSTLKLLDASQKKEG